MLKILWLSDKMIGGYSAYSKVTYQCCTRLAKLGHKVAHIPMMRANRMGKQAYQNVLIYPSGEHPFAEDCAIDHYVDWKADMLIALKETWVFNNIFKYAINFVPYCFTPNTPITLFDGTSKPIANIKTEDIALGFNGNTLVPNRVLLKTARFAKTIYQLSLEDGRLIHGTGEHPVFVTGRGYIPIEKINIGEMIPSCMHACMHVSIRQGRFEFSERDKETQPSKTPCEVVRVASIVPKKYEGIVYNLTTETGNFLANDILVHNCPVDHEPVSPALTSRMHTAFRVLTPSRFGARELRHAGVENVHYMPHGVPTDIYQPLEDKAECRKHFFLDPDEFVVLYVGWNRVRKMLGRMLRGYKRFRELNPDVKSHFMLWTNVRASRMPAEAPMGVADVGVNLLPEMVNLKLTEACRWPDWKEVQKIGGLSEWDPTGGWDMVKLYNSCDVLLGTTGGEGGFLPGLEAQACGKPIIVTDYASAPEIVGAGLTVPWHDYNILVTPGCKFALPDIDKMAEALTKIMNSDPSKLARRARRFAERYDWPKIIERYWKPFLEEAESELKPLITKEGIKSWA